MLYKSAANILFMAVIRGLLQARFKQNTVCRDEILMSSKLLIYNVSEEYYKIIKKNGKSMLKGRAMRGCLTKTSKWE